MRVGIKQDSCIEEDGPSTTLPNMYRIHQAVLKLERSAIFLAHITERCSIVQMHSKLLLDSFNIFKLCDLLELLV